MPSVLSDRTLICFTCFVSVSITNGQRAFVCLPNFSNFQKSTSYGAVCERGTTHKMLHTVGCHNPQIWASTNVKHVPCTSLNLWQFSKIGNAICLSTRPDTEPNLTFPATFNIKMHTPHRTTSA
jgi:hypothetical protein